MLKSSNATALILLVVVCLPACSKRASNAAVSPAMKSVDLGQSMRLQVPAEWTYEKQADGQQVLWDPEGNSGTLRAVVKTWKPPKPMDDETPEAVLRDLPSAKGAKPQ